MNLKKVKPPLLQWIIQSSAFGGADTVGMWYCVIPLDQTDVCESSLFLFTLCYFICYVKKTYIFIEKQIVIFLCDFGLGLN